MSLRISMNELRPFVECSDRGWPVRRHKAGDADTSKWIDD